MIKFSQTLENWQTDLFSQSLKKDIAGLKTGILPLQQATTQGGIVNDDHLTTTVLSHYKKENSIIISIGIFFTEIIPSCSCGYAPMGINANTTFKLRHNDHNPDI